MNRSISPLTARKENVLISIKNFEFYKVPRSKSPINRQQINNNKFYNRFYRQEQRYQILQEQIEQEIRSKANSKKITDNSYRIIAHYLQDRIKKCLEKFQQEKIIFEQLGIIFTELQIFEAIQFDQDGKFKFKQDKQTLRSKQEMIMHDQFWNLASENDEAQKQIVNYMLRILMDPIKLDQDETAELLLDMVEYNIEQQYTQYKELAKKLVVQFRALTQNKTFSLNEDKKKQSQQEYIELKLRELTFTPKINKQSESLATQNRIKYIEDKELNRSLFGDSQQQLSFYDILDARNQELRQKQEIYEQIRQENEVKQCTFHPVVNNPTYHSNPQELVNRLYSTESIQTKQLIKQEQYKLANAMRQKKEMEQCTFKPTINEGIPFIEPEVPKDYEKVVGRMKYAQEQYRQKKEKLEHIPCGENYEKVRNQPFNPPNLITRERVKRKPIVIMDVNISSGKQGRLVLHEDEDPNQVIKQFAKLFNLNQEISIK
ncbi:hypothetical protein pb186bvf_016774 [Paramecium bursaria]